MTKAYFSDNLCASFDGEYLWLTTSNGTVTTNEIVLTPALLEELLDFIKGPRTEFDCSLPAGGHATAAVRLEP